MKQVQSWRLTIFTATYPLIAMEVKSCQTSICIIRNQIHAAEKKIEVQNAESKWKGRLDYFLLIFLMIFGLIFNLLYSYQVNLWKNFRHERFDQSILNSLIFADSRLLKLAQFGLWEEIPADWVIIECRGLWSVRSFSVRNSSWKTWERIARYWEVIEYW